MDANDEDAEADTSPDEDASTQNVEHWCQLGD
jgi:hypothetical protein